MSRLEHSELRGTRVHIVLTLVAIGMFGFAFALVPLYDSLCRVLGINGKIEQVEYVLPEAVPAASEVRVELVTSGSDRTGWQFYPLVHTVVARPGEVYTVRFHAGNMSGRPMTARAVASVTPGEVARYLVKTDCFCFEEQSLDAGESAKLVLSFYVDPGLPKKFRTLTLSYALLETEHE